MLNVEGGFTFHQPRENTALGVLGAKTTARFDAVAAENARLIGALEQIKGNTPAEKLNGNAVNGKAPEGERLNGNALNGHTIVEFPLMPIASNPAREAVMGMTARMHSNTRRHL